MSTLEVDKIIPQSGTALQVGENGDTITVPAGATLDASNATTTLPSTVVTTTGTQTLTNKSIVATQLTGTITPSDNTVTLAKMAPGTDGNIISYDASGNPVAVATGSAGQVLTSAGAGAPPTFAAAGVAGISSSADATAMTITSAEKIGIGETTPLGLVHMKQSDVSQGSVNEQGNTLVIEGSACGITMLSGTSGVGNIFFGDSGDPDIGRVSYDHGANMLIFNTNARTPFTISNTGQTVIDSNASGLAKNIEIKRDGTKAGIVGCEGTGNIVVGSGDIGLKFDNTNNIYRPYNVDTGSGVDNTGDLGSGSHRFKVIYAGTGSINTSDERHKNNIVETDLGLDFVNKLKPKKYKLNDGQSGRTHYGLISQDVETLLGEISKSTTDFAGFIKTDISEDNTKDIANIDFILDGNTDEELTEEKITELNAAKTKVQNKNDDIYALRYEEFISPIIKAIQELTTRIKALESK